MEEYVPANNPINKAIEKLRIPSAPNINRATTTKITVRTVLTERPSVCRSLQSLPAHLLM